MKTTILRATVYALGVLAVLAVWELLTLQLPPQPMTPEWEDTVWVHVQVVAVVTVAAAFGGLFGFVLLRSRVVALWKVVMLGAVLGWPLSAFFAVVAVSAGLTIAVISAVLIAAVGALGGGSMVSANAA